MPRAGAYVIGGELIVLKKAAPLNQPLFTLAEARALAPAGEMVFLGLHDGAARFGIGIAPAAAESAEDARGLPGHRPALDRGAGAGRHRASAADRRGQGGAALARAPPLLLQLRRGDASRAKPAGGATARACKAEHFPRTDPVVIMLAIDGERCLLGR